MRCSNACNSSLLKTLSRLSMGISWRTCLKAVSGWPPTRTLGEAGVFSSGCSASSAISSRIRRSYSASGTVGLSST